MDERRCFVVLPRVLSLHGTKAVVSKLGLSNMGRNQSTLIIQDDVYDGSLHLDEVLLDAIPHAEKGAAAFAFATADGLSAIFDSDEFTKFCLDGHHFDLFLGIDSITNLKTLARARELSNKHNGLLNVRVYYDSRRRGIFHPKTTWFENPGGDGCVAFVGSGNLTHAGLQQNVEIFSWIEQDATAFATTLSTWNGWIAAASAAGNIHTVDAEIVEEKARENGLVRPQAKPTVSTEVGLSTTTALSVDEGGVIISAMPSQKTRGWGQFVMAKEYYTDYFGFSIGDDPDKIDHRILLKPVFENGETGPMVSAKGNISRTSHNYRLELAAARNVKVDAGARPVVVFVKTGERTYLYQVFGSNSKWTNDLLALARQSNDRLRKTENVKCRISVRKLMEAMPDLPLVNAIRRGDE